MDIKIQALQRAEGTAVEKARKLLPRDADALPEALRCEYPRHVQSEQSSSVYSFMLVRLCAFECSCSVKQVSPA